MSAETIKRLEKMDGPLGSTRVDTLDKLRRTLEEAGIEFLNHGQPGVRLTPEKAMATGIKQNRRNVETYAMRRAPGTSTDPRAGREQEDRFLGDAEGNDGQPKDT